jgi:hypothetical protein
MLCFLNSRISPISFVILKVFAYGAKSLIRFSNIPTLFGPMIHLSFARISEWASRSDKDIEIPY